VLIACHQLSGEPGKQLSPGLENVILEVDATVTPAEARAAVRALRLGGATRVIADVSRATRAATDALAAEGVPFVTRPMT
jgi:hypothetical protein